MIKNMLLLSAFYFARFFTFLFLISKTSKKLSFSSYNYFFTKVIYQYLVLLVGFDTLIYRNATNDPLQLRVIMHYFLAPLPGSVALLVSEVGKEVFIFLFLFFRCCFCPYGHLYSWIVLYGETPHNCGGHSYPY